MTLAHRTTSAGLALEPAGSTPPRLPAREGSAPDQASQLRDLVRRQAAPRPPMATVSAPAPAHRADAVGHRTRVIAITSGKGGVGKSNLAVNLAARFAMAGKRTLLLDADMGLANADVLCGMNLRHNLAHVIARRKQLEEIIADAPGGFRLIGGASGLAQMADLPEQEHRRLLAALAQLERACDVMLIDTGAGISRNVLSFTQAADHVLVVTTAEPTAIADAYAIIKVMSLGNAGLGARPISLVVNQARSAAEARRVHERLAKVAGQFLGARLGDAGYLPFDAAVGRAVRSRRPFVLSEPKSAAAVCLTRLAVRLQVGMAASPADRKGQQSLGFFAALARLVRPQLAPGFP